MKITTQRVLMLTTLMAAAVPAWAEMTPPATTQATSVGAALVTPSGMTLYFMDGDTDAKSMCNGECATNWPPLAVAAGAEVMEGWTFVTRDDGTNMWAFHGHPLYTFVADTAPGDATGDGKNGFHLAKDLTASGEEVIADVSTAVGAAIKGTSVKGAAWVDANGMTLYNYEKDEIGKSMCNDECAAEWPPLPVAAGAVADGDMTIVVRDDGSEQWALFGRPLYTFVEDKLAGEITGDHMDGFFLAK